MILCSNFDFYIQVVVGIRFWCNLDGLKMGIGWDGTFFPRVYSAIDANIGSIGSGVFAGAIGLQMIVVGIVKGITALVNENTRLRLTNQII